MGGLFKDILGSSESLFKEKSDVPLDFSFIPKLVPYREMEQRAIVENYQQKDGSIKVPAVLQKYMGKKVIGKRE